MFDIVTDPVLDGSFSARARPVTALSGEGFSLRQSVSVTPGQTYVLSGLAEICDLESGNFLDLNDVPFENSVLSTRDRRGPQFIFGTFTVPNGVNSLVVRVVRDGTVLLRDFAYIDQVAITPIDDFVPPTPIDLYADLDDDGQVATSDLLLLLAAWGSVDASISLDCDDVVGIKDLLILLGEWS